MDVLNVQLTENLNQHVVVQMELTMKEKLLVQIVAINVPLVLILSSV